MSTTIRRKFGHELAGRFSYDRTFNFACSAAALAAFVHICWLIVSFVAFRRRLDAVTTVIVDWDPSVLMMHIRIGIALLLSVAGLFSRRMIGLFVSTLALVWVGLEYAAWWFWSKRIRSNAEIQTFPSWAAEASNLYGASFWNLLVLVLVIVILLWEMVRSIKLVRSQVVQRPNVSKR